MKRQVPTERDIANLITTAFEHLPQSDASRLSSIEQKLLKQPRLRGRTKFAWWWLVGALVAGAASALWWAVDYHDSGEKSGEPIPVMTSPATAPSATDRSSLLDKSENKESSPIDGPSKKPGPMIYQRER